MERKVDNTSYFQVDWEKLSAAIEQSEQTFESLTIMIRQPEGYLEAKARENDPIESVEWDIIAQFLGISADEKKDYEFIQPQIAETSESKEVVDLSPLIADLKEIKALLEELEDYITSPEGTNLKISIDKNKEAKVILERLLKKHGGSVPKSTFESELNSKGIGTSYVTRAINETGCEKKEIGKGISKITVIERKGS